MCIDSDIITLSSKQKDGTFKLKLEIQMKKQILTQQDRKVNFAQKQWTVEDQALGHYAIQVDRFPDLIAQPTTSFNSVKAIAGVYAEIDDDFRTIFNDMNMLIEIDKKLKKRIETETISIHGRFYDGDFWDNKTAVIKGW